MTDSFEKEFYESSLKTVFIHYLNTDNLKEHLNSLCTNCGRDPLNFCMNLNVTELKNTCTEFRKYAE